MFAPSLAGMFKGASNFDGWRVFLRAFRYRRRPSVSRWRRCGSGSHIKCIHHHLRAGVRPVTRRNTDAPVLPPGIKALQSRPLGGTLLSPSVLALVPRSILLCPHVCKRPRLVSGSVSVSLRRLTNPTAEGSEHLRVQRTCPAGASGAAPHWTLE